MWQVHDLRERNLRVLADMENLRERSAKAAQSTKQYAIQARHWVGIFVQCSSITWGHVSERLLQALEKAGWASVQHAVSMEFSKL